MSVVESSMDLASRGIRESAVARGIYAEIRKVALPASRYCLIVRNVARRNAQAEMMQECLRYSRSCQVLSQADERSREIQSPRYQGPRWVSDLAQGKFHGGALFARRDSRARFCPEWASEGSREVLGVWGLRAEERFPALEAETTGILSPEVVEVWRWSLGSCRTAGRMNCRRTEGRGEGIEF